MLYSVKVNRYTDEFLVFLWMCNGSNIFKHSPVDLDKIYFHLYVRKNFYFFLNCRTLLHLICRTFHLWGLIMNLYVQFQNQKPLGFWETAPWFFSNRYSAVEQSEEHPLALPTCLCGCSYNFKSYKGKRWEWHFTVLIWTCGDDFDKTVRTNTLF